MLSSAFYCKFHADLFILYKVDDRYETILDKKGVFRGDLHNEFAKASTGNDFAAEFDQLSKHCDPKAG